MKLCTVRTWEHMTKTEVKIFVIVIISMVTFDKIDEKVPEGLISRIFNEETGMKCFCSCLKSGWEYQE